MIAMAVMVALIVALLWVVYRLQARCSECGAIDQSRAIHGVWWHREGCPAAGPFERDDESDDE